MLRKYFRLSGWWLLWTQFGLLAISMIALSFITDTEIWNEYFNYNCVSVKNECSVHAHENAETVIHRHWNYRGWVYMCFGALFLLMSIIRIIMSIAPSDFKTGSEDVILMNMQYAFDAGKNNVIYDRSTGSVSTKYTFHEWSKHYRIR